MVARLPLFMQSKCWPSTVLHAVLTTVSGAMADEVARLEERLIELQHPLREVSRGAIFTKEEIEKATDPDYVRKRMGAERFK
jgi:hypothetical protein